MKKGFWFQLTGEDKQKLVSSGPHNVQALNRYSYVMDNPLRYNDPAGHGQGDCTSHPGCGGVVVNHSETQSVQVYGSVRGCSSQGCIYYNTWVTLKPGESSIDHGMYDVDMVQADNGQKLYDPGTEFWCLVDCQRAVGPGHDTSEVYKVNSGEQVDIYDKPLQGDTNKTGLVVYSSPNYRADKPIWWMFYATQPRGWRTCDDATKDCHSEPYKWKEK